MIRQMVWMNLGHNYKHVLKGLKGIQYTLNLKIDFYQSTAANFCFVQVENSSLKVTQAQG